MQIITEINPGTSYFATKALEKHLKNGNNGEFEIHLNNAYGSPVWADEILDYSIKNNIKLKTYTTGKISDGGVKIIFGSDTNIAFKCTKLNFTHHQPLYNDTKNLYHKTNKYDIDVLNYVLNNINEGDEWEVNNNPIPAEDLIEYNLFKEIRQGYKSTQYINDKIEVFDLDKSVNNGHICTCSKCRGKFKPIYPLGLCKCGRYPLFTTGCDGECKEMQEMIDLDL